MLHVAGCKIEDPEHEGMCRDGRGSPRIILPDGKTVRSYSRASSYGDALDDKSNLIAWSQANALRGALVRTDLHRQFGMVDDGWVTEEAKAACREVIEELARAGGSEVKADKGSNVHRWSELFDLGREFTTPDEHVADLWAYEYATEGMEHRLIEQFCALDSHKIAGTPDRITDVPDRPCPECGLVTYVFDLKTGRVGFAQKMAVQLAIYSRSVLYRQVEDPVEGIVLGVREPLPQVCQHRAIILHLPAGSGSATKYWIDIDAGWHAVEHEIPMIKAWRKREVLTPFVRDVDVTP